MITWEIIPEVEHPSFPGVGFWQVNGQAADPDSPRQDIYDPRHFANLPMALNFLHDRMKMGDTLHVSGNEGVGAQYQIRHTQIGQKFEYYVGTRAFANPEELFAWMAATLKPGDTVEYLVSPT